MNKERTGRILKALKEMGLTQMLIVDPMSIFYLTGVQVAPFERFYGLYLREDGRHAYFLNRLFHVPEDTGVEKVWYSDMDPVMELVAQHVDKEQVLGVDRELKAGFLLPLMELKAAKDFAEASDAVDRTRAVKDEEEQEKMRLSSRINDLAMERFKDLIREGITEAEAASGMLDIYRSLGADGFSFEPLVAFGVNAADPHHAPDGTVLRPGDAVLFDVGCIRDGYCSDMTRTFFYRQVKEEHRNIYDTVRRANEAAIARIRPGIPLRELDQTARSLIEAEGYGAYFTHRLGHFIGLGEHEHGDVSSVSEQKAEPGMIFSIEPGIYLPGDVGVRVEDLVLVTEDGCEVLNHFSKELEIIGSGEGGR
ncbi:MAG: aminopeptidase P family protein [Lachnospiraceae bacterium]|nr:aminopeptidase P family protein [Lachnospiraceae bacterium]